MIFKAKYVGPFHEVQVPGFESKTCKRGETVTLRIPDGMLIGGCWEVLSDDQTPPEEKANDAPEAVAANAKKKGG